MRAIGAIRQLEPRLRKSVLSANQIVSIVDYALPENPIASKLVYHLVKLYERDNYAEFVRSDMHAMLDRAGLAARTEAQVAPGAAVVESGDDRDRVQGRSFRPRRGP